MVLLRSSSLLLCWWLLRSFVHGSTGGELSPQEFNQRILSGDYDVIVDVRRRDDEWNLGHIQGATLVESLASYTEGGGSSSIGSPSDLAGCEYCDIIVYCRSGVRATAAIQILRNAGFKNLWNGLGIRQWTDSGFDLVTTESVVPPCTVNQTASDACYDKYNSAFGIAADNTEAPAPSSSLRATGFLWMIGIIIVLAAVTF